jgi:hypothetical protein
MDIKVNLKKCELIVINPSVPIPLQKVTLDAAKSHWITPVHSDARYLGVWISAKRSKQHTKKRIEELRDQFIKILENKQISNAHSLSSQQNLISSISLYEPNLNYEQR